jgi:hypothetical protein
VCMEVRRNAGSWRQSSVQYGMSPAGTGSGRLIGDMPAKSTHFEHFGPAQRLRFSRTGQSWPSEGRSK